jgi:hypothetical protein
MATINPEDRPELPDTFANLSIICPEGANLRQAYDHMQVSKIIDSFSSLQLSELKDVAKGLLSLYIAQQIVAAKMAKQEFTNIDGV